MIGGQIIEVAPQGDNRHRLWCHEIRTLDECAVIVEADAKHGIPQVGDHAWWQGGYVYWTPKGWTTPGAHIKLVKVGYSFDPRPAT